MSFRWFFAWPVPLTLGISFNILLFQESSLDCPIFKSHLDPAEHYTFTCLVCLFTVCLLQWDAGGISSGISSQFLFTHIHCQEEGLGCEKYWLNCFIVVVVQLLSHVWLTVTPWTAVSFASNFFAYVSIEHCSPDTLWGIWSAHSIQNSC